jgi:hypothetical protein
MNSAEQGRKEGNGGRRGDLKEKQRRDRHAIRHCALFGPSLAVSIIVSARSASTSSH